MTEEVKVKHSEVQGSQAVHIEAPEEAVADPATAGMPEGGDVKFWDAETKTYSWENHAKELRFKLEQKAKGTEAEPATEPATAEATPTNLEEAAESAGIDINAANAYAVKHGVFPENVLAAAEKLGFPREAINAHAQWVKGTVDLHVATVTEAIGDIDMANAWLAENYTDAEIDALNQVLQDPGKWRLGIQQLRQDMGLPPESVGTYVRGQNQAAPSKKGSSEAFTDADLQRAIASPQWKDAKFREEIYSKARAAGMMHRPSDGRRHAGGM